MGGRLRHPQGVKPKLKPQFSPREAEVLKQYDLVLGLRRKQSKSEELTRDERESFRSTLIKLNRTCSRDTHFAKILEKERGAVLVVNGRYNGLTLGVLSYWAYANEHSENANKLALNSGSVAITLVQQVMMGKDEMREMTWKSDIETMEQAVKLQRQFIRENTKVGVGLEEKEKSRLTYRTFYMRGFYAHVKLHSALQRRAKAGDTAAKDQLQEVEKWLDASAWNNNYYKAKLNLALAMLKNKDVREATYRHSHTLLPIVEQDISKDERLRAINESIGQINKRISESEAKLGKKKNAWKARRSRLKKNVELGGVLSLELVRKSNEEVEELFGSKTKLAENLVGLYYARIALQDLAKAQKRERVLISS